MKRMRSFLVVLSIVTLFPLTIFADERAGGSSSGKAVSKEAAATYAEVEQMFGFVPTFIKQFPPEGVEGAWQEIKALEFGETAIPAKYKSLIAIAIAAQIPCQYCLYVDTRSAKIEGATDAEIYEAIAMSAITRHWSTILNGGLVDDATFQKEASQMFAYAQNPTKRDMAPAAVTDADSAYRDIEATFGLVPGFMRLIPKQGIAGAWKEMKNVQMSSNTAIPPKYKEAIGLAVAAQIPCRFCAYFHTEAMKLNGATEEEIQDALAISALTRHWSTMLNGSQADMAQFRREWDKVFANMEKQAKKVN